MIPTISMRRLLSSLFHDVKAIEARIAEVSKEIEAAAMANDTARRLMTIPGIGALTASGLLAVAGAGLQFRKARDMAAWLGLVSREHSTGAKPNC
jgi:transposase